MNKVFKGALTAALLAGSTVAATAPAQADYRHHRSNGSTAVVAGIAGLAIGAAIASSNRGGGYYDNGGYYQEPVGYYADPAPVYYSGGYGYAPSYGYAYGGNYDYRRGGYRGGYGWSDRGRGHYDHYRGHDNGRHNGWDRDGRR